MKHLSLYDLCTSGHCLIKHTTGLNIRGSVQQSTWLITASSFVLVGLNVKQHLPSVSENTVHLVSFFCTQFIFHCWK